MDEGFSTILKVAGGGVLVGLGAILSIVLRFWLQLDKQKSEAGAGKEAREASNLQQAYEWMRAISVEHKQAAQLLLAKSTRCDERYAEVKGVVTLLYGIAKHQYLQLVKLGADPSPIPDLPTMHDSDDHEIEFKFREAAEKVELLHAQIINGGPAAVKP